MKKDTRKSKPKKRQKKIKTALTAIKKDGRPPDYIPAFNELAFQLSLLGATDVDMCKTFEVSEQTLNVWKRKYPKFIESINSGKIKADAKVAAKLYDRAIGAEYYEQAAFKVKNQEAPGKFTEDVKIVDLKKTMPPDTGAIAIWLKNRQGKNWKDKPEIAVQVDISLQNAEKEIKDLVPLQIQAMREIMRGTVIDGEYEEIE